MADEPTRARRAPSASRRRPPSAPGSDRLPRAGREPPPAAAAQTPQPPRPWIPVTAFVACWRPADRRAPGSPPRRPSASRDAAERRRIGSPAPIAVSSSRLAEARASVRARRHEAYPALDRAPPRDEGPHGGSGRGPAGPGDGHPSPRREARHVDPACAVRPLDRWAVVFFVIGKAAFGTVLHPGDVLPHPSARTRRGGLNGKGGHIKLKDSFATTADRKAKKAEREALESGATAEEARRRHDEVHAEQKERTRRLMRGGARMRRVVAARSSDLAAACPGNRPCRRVSTSRALSPRGRHSTSSGAPSLRAAGDHAGRAAASAPVDIRATATGGPPQPPPWALLRAAAQGACRAPSPCASMRACWSCSAPALRRAHGRTSRLPAPGRRPGTTRPKPAGPPEPVVSIGSTALGLAPQGRQQGRAGSTSSRKTDGGSKSREGPDQGASPRTAQRRSSAARAAVSPVTGCVRTISVGAARAAAHASTAALRSSSIQASGRSPA